MESASPNRPAFVSAPIVSPSFHDFVESLLVEFGVPGASIGIIKLKGLGNVKKGEEEVQIELKQYGYATLPSQGVEGKKVTEDTIFGIASNSKAFTAASIAKLVEDGNLSWRTPVTTILPTLAFRDPVANQYATVVDLLSHRTGLPRHENSYRKGDKHAELVSKVKGLLPSSEFREQHQYNNQMYTTAAYLVRHLTGKPFTSYLSEYFLEPLGMASSTFRPLKSPHLAIPYVTLEDRSQVELPYALDVEDESVELVAGPYGLVSNTKDMLKWVQFLIRQRHAALESARNEEKAATISEPDKPISPNSVLYMTSSHSIEALYSKYPEESAKTYGLGFRLGFYQNFEMVMHGGDVPGCGSQVAWSSEHAFGVVCLTNAAGSGNSVAGSIIYRVFEEILGLQQVNWSARYVAERTKSEAKTSKMRDEWNSAPTHPEQLDLSKYLGTYTDYSYGNVTVLLPVAAEGSPAKAEDEKLRKSIATARLGTPALKAIDLLIYAPGYFGLDHVALQLKAGGGGHMFKATPVLWYEPVAGNTEGLSLNNPAAAFETEFELKEGRVTEMIWRKGVWGAGDETAKRDEEGRTEVAFEKV